MTDSNPPKPDSSAEPTPSVTNVRGGINADAQHDVNISGDAVGRDKTESAGGHIIHARDGATVTIIEGTPPAPEREDLAPAPSKLLSDKHLSWKATPKVIVLILAGLLIIAIVIVSRSTSSPEPQVCTIDDENFEIHLGDIELLDPRIESSKTTTVSIEAKLTDVRGKFVDKPSSLI
jgi:hypothetical protein